MGIFFVSMLIFMGAWHYLVAKYGKKKCWQISSFIEVFLFNLLIFCDAAHPVLLLVSSSLCAIGASGAYLNDVFISDIIDYDELLTGSRNEGMYTVFSTFIPKLVSIFAQAIPISILTSKPQ